MEKRLFAPVTLAQLRAGNVAVFGHCDPVVVGPTMLPPPDPVREDDCAEALRVRLGSSFSNRSHGSV